VAVRTRERQSASDGRRQSHTAPAPFTALSESSEEASNMYALRHYRVRLRRSRRLPYRIARLLVLALPLALMVIAYALAQR
jgi:hypothetical protein